MAGDDELEIDEEALGELIAEQRELMGLPPEGDEVDDEGEDHADPADDPRRAKFKELHGIEGDEVFGDDEAAG